MKLVLFDLDGTLLNTGASGVDSLEKAFKTLFGKLPVYDINNLVGKTDKHNMTYLYQNTFKKKPTAKQLESLKSEYLSLLPKEIAAQVKSKKYKPVTGVAAFLKALSAQKDVKLALATGNIEDAAKIKLSSSGLGKYFTTGGFGWDAIARTDLLQAAVKNASKHFKYNFKPFEVFVIGDTHIDIVAAKENDFHSAVVTEGALGDAQRIQRAAAELEVKDFKDINLFLVWLGEEADPKGVEKGSYIMPASPIEHVFFSRTGIDEQRLKMFRIKKYSDLESGKI